MKVAPCKDCDKRSEACHATCPQYAEWKSELNAHSQAEFEGRRKLSAYYAHCKDQARRRLTREIHNRTR